MTDPLDVIGLGQARILIADLNNKCEILQFERNALVKEIKRLHARPAEPLHEVVCPSCGATIRARMADATDQNEWDRLREQRAALLARCDQLAQSYATHPVLWISEIRELLGAAQR